MPYLAVCAFQILPSSIHSSNRYMQVGAVFVNHDVLRVISLSSSTRLSANGPPRYREFRDVTSICYETDFQKRSTQGCRDAGNKIASRAGIAECLETDRVYCYELIMAR